LVAKTSAAARAKSETAKACSSCAQMTTKPSRNTKTIELRTVTTHRRLASIVSAEFLAMERTTSVRAMRTESSRRSDLRLSRTMELSICGSHVIMDGGATMLA
jgi:hypothetical protein